MLNFGRQGNRQHYEAERFARRAEVDAGDEEGEAQRQEEEGEVRHQAEGHRHDPAEHEEDEE